MSTGKQTISYSRIVNRRPKAICLDIGEAKPAWFPLSKIEMDEAAYTVTGPGRLIEQKLAEAQGAPMTRDPKREARVTLPPPSWESETQIGIDVIICGYDGSRKTRQLLYFPKSQMQGNTAPRWLVEIKQNEALDREAKKRRWERNDLVIKPFEGRGLLTETAALEPEPDGPTNENTPRPGLKGAWDVP